MGTSCKKIHIRKKIRKKMRKKIQEDTFNDPVSTPYGKANSSLRPDSFLKSLVILKMFALAALVQKFVRMTSDFKKLITGPGKNYILPCCFSPSQSDRPASPRIDAGDWSRIRLDNLPAPRRLSSCVLIAIRGAQLNTLEDQLSDHPTSRPDCGIGLLCLDGQRDRDHTT